MNFKNTSDKIKSIYLSPDTSAVLIWILFIQCILIRISFGKFGLLISKAIVLFVFFWSFFLPIITLINDKEIFKAKLF